VRLWGLYTWPTVGKEGSRGGVSGPGGVNMGAVGTRGGHCEAMGTGGTCSRARACAAVSEGEAGEAATGCHPNGGGIIPMVGASSRVPLVHAVHA
jgi:hypothetical protein